MNNVGKLLCGYKCKCGSLLTLHYRRHVLLDTIDFKVECRRCNVKTDSVILNGNMHNYPARKKLREAYQKKFMDSESRALAALHRQIEQ